MKTARWLLALAVCLAPAFATYSYDYPILLNPYVSTQWTSNGTNSVSTNMYTSSATNGGSLIFTPTLPSPSTCYDVSYTMALNASGGNYITYLRATSNAQYASTSTGTFYAVEIANPNTSLGYYSATLNFIKPVNGVVSIPYSTIIYPSNGAVFRIVMIQGNAIDLYINSQFWTSYYDSGSPITSGQPGVGVSGAPSGNGMTNLEIGHLVTLPPSPINAQLVGTSAFPNYVDIQFPDVLDPNGPGVAYYQFYRNGNYLALNGTTNIEDRTVAAGTSYSYLIQAVDFHANVSQVTITVVTPPAGAIDPREVGVRPTGTYWGGAGEQIDVRSANLNFTIPLIKAMGRGGNGISFNLSYNAQNWRQDPGGTWQLGRDLGYGYGWRLQAGSLTPVYDNLYTIDHYEFTDSTGATYRLAVNTNGVWSSQESVHIYYNASTNNLYFPDGSMWGMGCTSAGSEQDSGTMYPTSITDSNGNWVNISYDNGVGVTTFDSSSRIYYIYDVRGYGSYDYTFAYNGDAIPHLTGINNSIGTAENYTLNYAESQPLTSPFTPSTGYGSWTFLSSIANAIPLTTSFTYDPNGSGELDKVTFPYGGHLRWTYSSFTYAGSVTQRELDGRYLSMSAGAPEGYYEISGSPPANTFFHSYMVIDGADGNSEKAWLFGTTSGQASYGLLTELQSKLHPENTTGGRFEDYTWTADSAGNPYISKDLTTEDYGNPTQIQKQTTQTLDQYGNLTQMQVFNYGNLTTPVRTYTNTYLNSSTYTSVYILNRLLTSTVTDGTYTTTLVTNSYDQTILANTANIQNHYSGYGTSYTTRGNVTTSVTPKGTTLINYDIAGNAIYTSVNGLVTNSTVSTATNYTAPSQITTNSLSSSMNWSTFLGLSSATGPNGDTGSIAYDTNARPHTSTSPLGAVTTYTYNDSASPPNKVATINGHWVQTNMDGFGRTIETQTGNGATIVSLVDTQYVACGCSPLGKVGQTSQPYAPGGTVYWTTYTYDGMGRTTQSELADGSITHYSYAGNTVTVNDPAGKTKTFTMDALGNLTQVQETDPTLGTVTTTYTYDILNHLIKVSMPRGSTTQTRTFNYISGSTVGITLLSATNPENGTVTYTYNSDFTVHTKTDAKGQVFTYSYDSYKRLTQVQVGSTVLRTFMYDTNTLDSTFSGSYTAGRLVAVQNASFVPTGGTGVTFPNPAQFTEMYGYTQAGLTSKKRLQVNETFHYTVNGNPEQQANTLNLDAAYTYDIEGRVTSVNYPTTYNYNGSQLVGTAGPTYTYSFDSMDRPTGLKDQTNYTDVSNVTYNAANQLLGLTYFGTGESRAYNNLNQMTNVTVTGATSLNITYTFPAGTNNGKISSQTDAISGETVTYQYDSLNRLLSASGSGWGDTYGYDGFGNLLSKTGTGTAPVLSQSVNAATNQIVGATYDANGNQTTGIHGTAAYDAENRIVLANSVSYAYDSRNKRIWGATVSGGNLIQTVYFYGVDGQLLGTYPIGNAGNQGQVMVDFGPTLAVFFGGKRVGMISSSGVQTAFVQDRLGSAGKYYPYGEARGTVPQDAVGFATYTNDSVTGLEYADQRYYASNFGRFMSPDRYQAKAKGASDPLAPSSWNRYSYVLGDPINFLDPRGTTVCDANGDNCYDSTDVTDTSDTALTVTQFGGTRGPSYQMLDQNAIGIMNAQNALNAFATAHFSVLCTDFIDSTFGAGALTTLQEDAASVGVENAQDVTTPAGAALFPYNDDLAMAQQASADRQTGVAGTTLATLAMDSGTTAAWGQWGGNTIFINYASRWMDYGSGYAMYTMFHEMLHVAAMGGDTQIEAAFGISRTLAQQQGTASITYKLIAECGH